MTREEADFIGAMNMCDEISNEAYKKIMCHCEEQEPCEDCVSRTEIKKMVKEMYLEVANMELDVKTISDCISYTSSKCRQVLEDKLNNIKSVTPTQRWISVKERLPEESLNSVIGWDAYRERCVFVQFIDGHFRITGKNESFDIQAWMPLPNPYVPDTNVGKIEEMESEDGN